MRRLDTVTNSRGDMESKQIGFLHLTCSLSGTCIRTLDVSIRWHGHVVGSGIRVGRVDGFAERAVGTAGAVVRIFGFGYRERGGEGACGEQDDQKDQKAS